MKRILSLVVVAILLLSIFSTITLQIKAEPSETSIKLYAGTTNPGIVLEYKGGSNWESITENPSSLGWSVTSLISYEGALYASTISDPDIYSSFGRVWKYKGSKTWESVSEGLEANQVTFLIVYKGELYAGTATPARLYKYNPATSSWSKVLEYAPWFGFRSVYIWGDWLYLGEWYWDRFARWNGITFQEFQPNYWGSCIYSFEEYKGALYAGAYIGRIYKITVEPPVATAIWGPEPNYRYAWTLKSFKGYLYIGFDAGSAGVAPLYRYDGTWFIQVWSYVTATTNVHEGIISMANDGTYLYVGVGAQAVGYPTYMSGMGTGRVYRTLDGTTYELISGTLGTGVQVLYVPPLPDLAIVDIKPIQIISDAKALVALRPTVIRMSVKSTFLTRVWVDIFVFYDFQNRLYTEKGPYGNGTPIDPGLNIIYIPGGPIYQETREVHTSWTTDPPWLEWFSNGFDDKIEVWLDPLNRVTEVDETNNRMVTSMKIVFPRRLHILTIPVYFPDIGQRPFEPVMDYERDFFLATYPVAFRRTTPPLFEWVQRRAIPWSGDPRYWNIISRRWEWNMEWLYQNVVQPLSRMAETTGWNRTIIVLQSLGDYDAWGIAPGMLGNPENRIPVVVTSRALEVLPGVVAHEIGHTFYLWHPHDIGPEVYDAYRYWVVRHDYGRGPAPHMNTFMSYRSGVGLEVWIDKPRFDTEFRRIPPGTYEAPGDPVANVPPSRYRLEFGTIRWNLLDQLTVNPHTENVEPVILISGIIFKNNTVKLDPSYTLTGLPDVVNGTSGNYSIVLTNAGQVIARMGFNASFSRLMEEDGILRNVEWDIIPFTFKIPYFHGITKIEVRDIADNVLVTRTISPSPPVVDITYPRGGEILGGLAVHRISWKAHDPDGDALTYTVAYSADNGETWIPLAIDINETSYSWDTSDLETGKYLVKVIATDGVNVGEDVSDNTFTIWAGWTHATIDFDPDTLNLKSKGEWITVYIELPKSYNISQIDISSIKLNNTIPALAQPIGIGDYDVDDIPDLMVKFERKKVQMLFVVLPIPGKYLILLTGKVFDIPFVGTDIVTVISPP